MSRRGGCSNCCRCAGGGGFLVTATLPGERRRVSVFRRAGSRNGGQSSPKAFERVVPEGITRQWLETFEETLAESLDNVWPPLPGRLTVRFRLPAVSSDRSWIEPQVGCLSLVLNPER